MSLPIQPVKVCAECEQPTADYYAVNPRTGEHSKGEVYCLECYERGVRRQLHKEWDRKRALTLLRYSNVLTKTTAEEHLESAGKCLREAIKHLNAVLLDRCQGYSEYDNEYTAALNNALVSLLQARQRLNR
jgi:restriction endonuclease